MPSGTYTVKLPDRKIQVTTRELSDFRDLYLGTFEIGGPMSELMRLDIYIAQRELDTCSDLYFAIGDLVSIHLLASAAHEILAAFDRRVLKTGMAFRSPRTIYKVRALGRVSGTNESTSKPFPFPKLREHWYVRTIRRCEAS